MKLSSIKPNAQNPRIIKDERFKKLCQQIEQFPKMMALRPIVVDADGVILGGNMRYKALQRLGFKEIPDNWVRRAEELTEEEKRRFVITDNVGFGEWQWEELANEWNAEELGDWGLDVPGFEVADDYADKNKEIDINNLDAVMTITLKYTEDEFWQIKEQLSKIANTPEQAIWKLLGNEL
jgi:hypothetical protein